MNDNPVEIKIQNEKLVMFSGVSFFNAKCKMQNANCKMGPPWGADC